MFRRKPKKSEAHWIKTAKHFIQVNFNGLSEMQAVDILIRVKFSNMSITFLVVLKLTQLPLFKSKTKTNTTYEC